MQTKERERREEREKKERGREKKKEKKGKEKRERERETERTGKRMGEGRVEKGQRKDLVQTEDRRLECICRQLVSQHFQSP